MMDRPNGHVKFAQSDEYNSERMDTLRPPDVFNTQQNTNSNCVNIDWEKEFAKLSGKKQKQMSAEKLRNVEIDWEKELQKMDKLKQKELARKKTNAEKENFNVQIKRPWVSSTKKSPLDRRNRRTPGQEYEINSNKRRKVTTSVSAHAPTSTLSRPEIKCTGSTTSKVKKNLFGIYREPKSRLPVKTRNNTVDSKKKPDLEPLPDLDGSSCTLFKKHEEECGILHNTTPPVISPLSGIITKLSNTSISNNYSDIDELKTDLLSSMEIYNVRFKSKMRRYKQLLNQMETEHENFVSEINGKLKCIGKQEKLNGAFKFTTPKSSKKDLRITMFNKNLQKSVKGDRNMEKAMDQYNKFRQNAPTVFNTPKTDRKELLEMNSKSVSTKLQQQCLMLLDTPVRK